METESTTFEALIQSTICQYKNLVGISQSGAEDIYITIVMQLEGYGYETFSAKVHFIIK